MTLKFENVNTSSYYRYGLSFGDLQDRGFLTKQYIPARRHEDPEAFSIRWTVVGDIEFTDSQGNHWKQGDEIVWER